MYKSKMGFPKRYAPKGLTRKDRTAQMKMLQKSKKLYLQHRYYTRSKLSSFKNKKSTHVSDALRIYHLKKMTPNHELARKTGCTLSSLKQIVKKGEGAYYSSGSRPNQTPQSWGLARLASAITSGKAAAVDFTILEKGCNHQKKSLSFSQKIEITNGSLFFLGQLEKKTKKNGSERLPLQRRLGVRPRRGRARRGPQN